MKVILIDDEPAMHLILSKMLLKLPGVHVAGAFSDTMSASSFLRENTDIGMAFIDLSMPGESGIEFAAKLEASNSPMQVVFVTSHKEFALEAYELSVIDYLVKPVSQERLQRAVNRALANHRVIHSPSLSAPVSADSGKIVLTMLGDVAISNEAGRVKWISRKCAELFAYLLLYRGKRIPRSRLVTDIFGGMHKANAENYLNTTVYQLRKSLEPLGMREVVRSENDGYALELKEPVIDYVEFEKQTEMLQSIDAGNVERALQIERLYTGDLFGDKAYVWAIHETERYAEMYALFVKRLAVVLISLRNTAIALKLLLKLNERNPLDESVIRHLMTIHEMTGDKKGLTALYTNYVRLLSRELGIRPSEELIHLYDLLLRRFSDKK
ncbi:response regulator [Paenibacillus radicis (ex Xue et al. 2023)]|uniref:Response regulator n=1 Tax=Paenibacillus radicis (ex Xue et al. 2023) TaxID=2972489 RepID=A0ABT1YHP1_9BACL|nr:response regulator [Paenibacillus radicis (ex Xue et al. 2023)]MCR8632703.1 response regulator [Paenibacillus radicis (ex Xue et al. 2023)]